MTVARRLLIHVAVGSAFVITVVAAVTYGLVYKASEQRAIEHLDTYVRERTQREEATFKTIYSNLEVVRALFLKRDKLPPLTDLQSRWNERFMLYPDGAWRSREEYYSPRIFSNLWLHKDAPLTEQFQTRVLRAQEICEDVQPGWIDSFSSVYFILPGPATMGFDPRIPRWSWQTPGDYDLAAEEWVKESTPERNPSRNFVWTGVFVDPPTKVPFVTVQLPVDKDGAQIATVAHDVHINQLFEEVAKSDFAGASHLIFRPDGRLIVHPKLREEILASDGALTAKSSGDPALESLYNLCIAHTERQFSGFEPVAASFFSASRLPAAEWYFVTMMPQSYVREQAFRSTRWVWLSGTVSLGLLFASLAGILRRQVTHPLDELSQATQAMSRGSQEIPFTAGRADEFGALAGSFREMAGRVAAREADLRQLNLELEQRVAERTFELQRLAAVLDLTPDFVGICDMEQRVIFLNRAAREFRGLASDAPLEGLRVEEFHPPWVNRLITEEMFPMALRDGLWTGEAAILDRERNEIPVSAAFIIPRGVDGKPEYGATIMRDISERKRVEVELGRALERERELVKLKSSFVSLVSHEFRTPLGVILSSSEILGSYFDTLEPAERAEQLDAINVNVLRMSGLMEEVLLFSKLEAGGLACEPEPIDLPGFCMRIRDEVMSATRARCDILWNGAGELGGARADESLLRHTLTNLLSNAVKYSPEGSAVQFQVRRDGEGAVFTVSDHGIGIPEEAQARLFHAFYRARNASSLPGTGLGLVVVKRCVELHGGTISLQSAEGAGTTVRVSLPLYAAGAS